MGEFYIDMDKAKRTGLESKKLSFRLNGASVTGVIAAKSGINGFIEFMPLPARVAKCGCCVFTKKLRGKVKISISNVIY